MERKRWRKKRVERLWRRKWDELCKSGEEVKKTTWGGAEHGPSSVCSCRTDKEGVCVGVCVSNILRDDTMLYYYVTCCSEITGFHWNASKATPIFFQASHCFLVCFSLNNSSSSPAAFFHWRNPVLGKQQQTGCPALNRIKFCFFSHLIPLETFTLRPCGTHGWASWLTRMPAGNWGDYLAHKAQKPGAVKQQCEL